MKDYWISLYTKIENQENLKKYSEVVTPIIKSFGEVPLVRGEKNKAYERENFFTYSNMEFPSYGKAIECHNSSEYQSGLDLAKETTVRHMQVIEGFSTE